MTLMLGVDPGVHGGLALVEIANGTAVLVEAIDIPTVGIKAKERVDVLALRTWITARQPQHAFIERAQAMPKQGASSGFKYGRATGSIEAVIACCEIPLTIVEPAVWKKAHCLRGGDKEGARQRALQLFPSAHALLARKKDHGRPRRGMPARAPWRRHSFPRHFQHDRLTETRNGLGSYFHISHRQVDVSTVRERQRCMHSLARCYCDLRT
jgi:crossover junction endodeoxyribonuclease RuvC